MDRIIHNKESGGPGARIKEPPLRGNPLIASRRPFSKQVKFYVILMAAACLSCLTFSLQMGRPLYLVFAFITGGIAVGGVTASLAATIPAFRHKFFTRRLRLTFEGIVFLALIVAIGVIALNSGVNLLFLILAMLISFILVSGMLSDISLHKVYVKRSVPGYAVAGKPFDVTMRIKNVKKRFAAYSVIVEDTDMEEHTRSQTACYAGLIPPGRIVATRYSAVIEKRGVYKLEYLEMGSRFPFNFFTKSLERKCDNELAVYPATGAITADILGSRARRRRMEPVRARTNERGSDEFFGIREFFPGDNPSRIDWKSTARNQKLMLKEFDREDDEDFVVIFDNCDRGNYDAYEKAVSFLATIAAEYRGSARGKFYLFDGIAKPGASSRSLADYHATLRRLAAIKPGSHPVVPGEIAAIDFAGSRGCCFVATAPPSREVRDLLPRDTRFFITTDKGFDRAFRSA